MPRYVAFLRGVMPTNAKMSELKRAFEVAGFTNVKTVLGSGNVVFDTRASSGAAIAKKAEAAMTKTLGRSFTAFVRSCDDLRRLLDSDPFASFTIHDDAKRIVTFLPEAPAKKPRLPADAEGVRILAVRGAEAFTVYRPNPRGPVFMAMLKSAFGEIQTTRTLDTVRKCASG